MKLASKQLLALGVPPTQVIELEKQAEEEDVALRALVQRIIRDWIYSNRPLP